MVRRSVKHAFFRSIPGWCMGLLLAGALVGCESPAQEGAAAGQGEDTSDASAVVTYAFSVPTPAAELSPSAPLVAELAQDPNLGRLTVSSGSSSDGQPVRELEAEFAFETVAAFLAWQGRAPTADLLERVAALTADTVAFQPRLSVRRPSLYRSVVGHIQAAGTGEGRKVESVTCNEDCSRIDVRYRTKANEAGGGAPGQGTGDAGDIDAVTLICQPGLAGTIENCTASN